MDCPKYLDKMKKIQENLLEFIDNEDNVEEKFQNLINLLKDQKFRDNENDLKSFLYLVLRIANNHHRKEGFFNKIERILTFFKDEIRKFYLNFEIFNIFKSNKRILLFLIEEKFIDLDKSILSIMTTGKYLKANYPAYFSPEIHPFIDSELANTSKEKQPDDHNEKRKIGENDAFIRNLIQKDLKEEFVVFALKSDLSFNTTVIPSVYETNSLLIKNQPTLLEYAAFYGSIQIFKYLIENNAQLTPLLWIYAVHGQNLEIIHLLEEKNIVPKDSSFTECFIESIKCHHIDIADYIKNNLLKDEANSFDFILRQSLKYYNFTVVSNDNIEKSLFYDLCKYDYYTLVVNFLKETDVDINARKIQIYFF